MLNSTVLELPETHLFYNILTNSSAYVQSSSEEVIYIFCEAFSSCFILIPVGIERFLQ